MEADDAACQARLGSKTFIRTSPSRSPCPACLISNHTNHFHTTHFHSIKDKEEKADKKLIQKLKRYGKNPLAMGKTQGGRQRGPKNYEPTFGT